ncbi:MAG: metallophosphoesterase [Planctomycetes bacterium]|nr:metallophosphoesterase [Planctomycetota bacterium]
MISRRKFIRGTALLGAGLGGAVGYGFWEAAHIRVTRQTVGVRNLSPAFEGKTIALLADFHHGPYVGMDFIREAVRFTNALAPDLIALVGDYAHTGGKAHIELPPCLEALSELKAPLGVFAVPGNHDMQRGGLVYHELIATTPLCDLTNRHQQVTLNGEHLWLAGVDDLWWGKPDLARALAGVPSGAAVVLLSHNPDFAEMRPDASVGLVLSGHTHGGQVYLPALGAPWLPSRYGEKYRKGLVQGPASSVFVSRGLGEAGVPLRVNVPPEVCMLTLTAA